MSEFVPESATSKEITVQESIFWTKSNQSVINKTNLKFGNDTKTFWFRFQMDIGMFVLSFLTLLTWTLLLPLA